MEQLYMHINIFTCIEYVHVYANYTVKQNFSYIYAYMSYDLHVHIM